MLRRLPGVALLVPTLALVFGCGLRTSDATASSSDEIRTRQVDREAATPRLTAFASQAELDAFLRELARSRGKSVHRLKAAAPPPSQGFLGAEYALSDVTNVQHAGVDEGGIVKVHGDYLVVLRRGRLFTVRLADDPPTPVSMVDAFGPDVDPRMTWYDEILVSEGTVVVIGYSYARGGTELGLFDLDRQGHLAHRATYHLRSNDYYSARNYSSRLLGRTLVFYTPLYLWPDETAPARSLPAIRKWRPGAAASEFVAIHSPRAIYRPLPGMAPLALHTVVTCDLASADFTCTAAGVMGPRGRVFYVSPKAVYVWTTGERSVLYRLSLEGAEPQAITVSGSPVDQFSFLEADDHLNVLVRAQGRGDGMWRSEAAAGDVALLRLPLSSFTGNVAEAAAWRYRPLPSPGPGVFQNRFVGRYLLYGAGEGWGGARPAPWAGEGLVAYRYADRAEPVTVPLGHRVDRIEALGTDAIVVGGKDRDLHFSSVRLGRRPTVVARYTRTDASQGELRSHGFFYRAETAGSGLLGLPIRAAAEPGYKHLFE
jgi:hypothetical protein